VKMKGGKKKTNPRIGPSMVKASLNGVVVPERHHREDRQGGTEKGTTELEGWRGEKEPHQKTPKRGRKARDARPLLLQQAAKRRRRVRLSQGAFGRVANPIED